MLGEKIVLRLVKASAIFFLTFGALSILYTQCYYFKVKYDSWAACFGACNWTKSAEHSNSGVNGLSDMIRWWGPLREQVQCINGHKSSLKSIHHLLIGACNASSAMVTVFLTVCRPSDSTGILHPWSLLRPVPSPAPGPFPTLSGASYCISSPGPKPPELLPEVGTQKYNGICEWRIDVFINRTSYTSGWLPSGWRSRQRWRVNHASYKIIRIFLNVWNWTRRWWQLPLSPPSQKKKK